MQSLSQQISLPTRGSVPTQETAIDEDDPGRGCLQIRVGLHAGPVVANVIGTRNKKLSIFGDTGTLIVEVTNGSGFLVAVVSRAWRGGAEGREVI
jgi:class 3 adenylate cyclase